MMARSSAQPAVRMLLGPCWRMMQFCNLPLRCRSVGCAIFKQTGPKDAGEVLRGARSASKVKPRSFEGIVQRWRDSHWALASHNAQQVTAGPSQPSLSGRPGGLSGLWPRSAVHIRTPRGQRRWILCIYSAYFVLFPIIPRDELTTQNGPRAMRRMASVWGTSCRARSPRGDSR